MSAWQNRIALKKSVHIILFILLATGCILFAAGRAEAQDATPPVPDNPAAVSKFNNQLQIIFGTGTVNKVFDEFTALSGVQGGTKEDVKQAAAAKAPLPQRLIKTLGDIFVPIIPAIVASGFLMGIMLKAFQDAPLHTSADRIQGGYFACIEAYKYSGVRLPWNASERALIDVAGRR